MTDIELTLNWSTEQKNRVLHTLLVDQIRREGQIPFRITDSDGRTVGFLVSATGELRDAELDLEPGSENGAVPYQDLLTELEREEVASERK